MDHMEIYHKYLQQNSTTDALLETAAENQMTESNLLELYHTLLVREKLARIPSS
jgi:hypothetical protein